MVTFSDTPYSDAPSPGSASLLQLSKFTPPSTSENESSVDVTTAIDESASVDEGATTKDEQYRLHRRFDRLGRLFGDGAVQHLMGQRVVVFGTGGVGSFAAEALARSAIGHLMLVDFDDVCVTNSNRQLQAMQGTIGKPKAEILRDRLRLVNPKATIESNRIFYNAERSDELLKSPWPGATDTYDFVLDCIDNITAKTHLIATCRERGIPVVSSMGAAGKLDPTRIRIADIADTQVCPLAKDVRRILRQKYGFPAKGKMGVTAIYSDEERTWPRALTYDGGEGFKCVCPHRSPEHGCDSRNLIDGTAVYVTGAFGLVASSVIVNTMTESYRNQAPPLTALRGTVSAKLG
jgi:tRNA A37 threonylcarbamoyladenosine dehydratase